MSRSLPIIDLSLRDAADPLSREALIAAVDGACRDTGFLLIVGHGVPEPVIRRMHAVSAEFFAQPVEAKRRMQVPAHQDIGWKAQGTSYLADTLAGGADGPAPQDWKESFGMGPIGSPADPSPSEATYFGKNIYPDAPPGFRAAYEAYYAEMERLAAAILQAFALCLGLDSRYFEAATDRHVSVLAVNHYPAQNVTPAPGQLRAGAHTDFGAITILHAGGDPGGDDHAGEDPGGLQVMDRTGAWIDVVPAPDMFVVNIGDLMAQWTNDRWVSTLHRVVNPVGARARLPRQSIAFFHQPNWHAEIACLPGCADAANPPKYKPTTSGAHLSMKLARLRGVAG
jgi:isopenicillin N synthase-like dioxygenase